MNWRKEENVKDPVCGMTMPISAARQVNLGGGSYYFCSETCEKSFLKENPSGQGTQDATDGDECGCD